MNRKERSHDKENHCGYLIILNLAKSLFVNMVLRQNLAETKVFKTGFKPKTWLSQRPFMNTSLDLSQIFMWEGSDQGRIDYIF